MSTPPLLDAPPRPSDSLILRLNYTPPSGQHTPYRLSLPASYAPTIRGSPLLLYFHGWGSDHIVGYAAKIHSWGQSHGLVVASPRGFADGRFADGRGKHWSSWNGSGTVASPGQDGRTCYDPNSTFAALCYEASCGQCADSCWWTTCEDSVAQVVALLCELERFVRIDETRIFAAGVSNGGVSAIWN
jgi:poly(3-hydroxybutyrate) depolymerase